MKKKDNIKIGRSAKKINERSENYNNRNGNRSEGENEEDKEYCLQTCVFNRKYNGDNEMIGCDCNIKPQFIIFVINI